MSRPSPAVLLSHQDRQTHRLTEILAAEGAWIVCLDGQPINLRERHAYLDTLPKYRRTAFATQSRATILRDRLNKQFATDRFTVRRVTETEELIDEELAGKIEAACKFLQSHGIIP